MLAGRRIFRVSAATTGVRETAAAQMGNMDRTTAREAIENQNQKDKAQP